MSLLKNHPFAVAAHFNRSVVLTFAFPKEQLQHLIPTPLSLDTFDDKWAFVAVAMVDTKGLRPKGFPSFFGNNFFLIGYRIFVRYINTKGKRLRGLYIIKSETNKKKMAFFGNIFTHYNYSTTDICQEITNGEQRISSLKSNFVITYKESTGDIPLPYNSPFNDWKEARRYAGPLPFTFTYNEENKEMLIIEGVRSNWKPCPIEILSQDFPFVSNLGMSNDKNIQPILANAFIIKDVPYFWRKGKLEKLDR